MTELRTHDVPDAVDPSAWTLRVTGAVSRPLSLSRAEVLEFPVETVTDDFACVEGWVAEDLSWRGVRVASLLDRAEPSIDGGYVLVRAMDGDYACSVPRERATDALLAVGLDGDSLPVEHGGPARFVPTDEDADCWESVKWVSTLELGDTTLTTDDTAERIATERLASATDR